MKLIKIISCFLLFLYSCNDAEKTGAKKSAEAENKVADTSAQDQFFPVTDFLKGQVAEIKKKGINPIKTTVKDKQQDSIWLKLENMDEEFAPFLSPVIDSANLKGLFTEKKFLDQTIDAFTFTYDPLKQLPDSFLLQRWDVYVDPKTNSVNRIYIVKKTIDHKTLQLTWQTNRSCRIVTISADATGKDHVEKEVTIKWDF